MKRASCGLDVHSPLEISSVLKSATENGYEFVCLPLVHPRFKREFTDKAKDRKGPFTRPDLVLKSNDWSSLIGGKISPYLDVNVECFHNEGKFALEQELSYGSHLEVPVIMIPLRSGKCHNLTKIVNSTFSRLRPQQIWVEVPMISHTEEASIWRSSPTTAEEENTWEWWNTFRTLCNSDKRLGIALKVSKNLPHQIQLDRWMGEPIRCVVIPTSHFKTNKKGYPILPKDHQIFIKSLVHHDIQVIIKGNNHCLNIECYQKYIKHLWQEASVQESLQLQNRLLTNEFPPFEGNSMFKFHEVFQRDYVKYREYIKAIKQALLDTDGEVLNVMVVGAGKGPLVFAVLSAAAEADRKVKIYAVENNPNAIVVLQAHKEEFWRNSVEILFEDIRLLNFPKKIDILASDLLGSFGDNELSPEILTIAQKFLKDKGISIPEYYTSYICPVQNAKVYSDVISSYDRSACEIPYVVLQTEKYDISQPKVLFSFRHPNRSDLIDNSRYNTLSFNVEQNCILHGFTGYFDTVLYKNIKLSIVPDTCTPGLTSWYPIFFPLLRPVFLKGGSLLEVQFWRIVSKTKVWYEWTITKPIPLQVHNPNGRSSNIPLG